MGAPIKLLDAPKPEWKFPWWGNPTLEQCFPTSCCKGSRSPYIHKEMREESTLDLICPGFDQLLHVLIVWQRTADLTIFLISEMGLTARLQCNKSTSQPRYSTWHTLGTWGLLVCLRHGMSRRHDVCKISQYKSTYDLQFHVNVVQKETKIWWGEKFISVVTGGG
jgi:hypothetical protein